MTIRYPILGHTWVAADPERLTLFLQGYEILASCVRSAESGLVDATHASMLRMLDKWALQDVERSKRERSVPADESVMRRRLSTLLPFAEQLEDMRVREEVRQTLESHIRVFEAIPSANARFVRMCLRRFERSVALDAPSSLMATEARLIAQALRPAKCPKPAEASFGREHGFAALLFSGLLACCRAVPSVVRLRDLGLGISNDVESILGLSSGDMTALLEADTGPDAAALEETNDALARYPLVPRGRVHSLGHRFSGVRGFLEASGPIGWAAADELPEMAAELRLLAATHPNVQPALECAARRIEEAALDGLSVIACVELLGYESDGRRSYFVRDYDFDDQLLE